MLVGVLHLSRTIHMFTVHFYLYVYIHVVSNDFNSSFETGHCKICFNQMALFQKQWKKFTIFEIPGSQLVTLPIYMWLKICPYQVEQILYEPLNHNMG